MQTDPVASMRCWAITVELGGREYEIPALPAADWWPVLTELSPAALLDLLKSEPDLDTMLLDGTLTGADLGEAWRDAIEAATGRSFHASFVLATVAQEYWVTIGGRLTLAGFRWDVQPIGAALDAIYVMVVENMKDEDRAKFDDLLENEALTDPSKKRAPSERVMTEFEAMAGPRPAPAPLPAGATGAPSDGQRPKTQPRPQQPRQGGRSAAPKKTPGAPGKSGPRASSGRRAAEE